MVLKSWWVNYQQLQRTSLCNGFSTSSWRHQLGGRYPFSLLNNQVWDWTLHTGSKSYNIPASAGASKWPVWFYPALLKRGKKIQNKVLLNSVQESFYPKQRRIRLTKHNNIKNFYFSFFSPLFFCCVKFCYYTYSFAPRWEQKTKVNMCRSSTWIFDDIILFHFHSSNRLFNIHSKMKFEKVAGV